MATGNDELLAYYRDSRGELLEAIAGLSDEALTEASLDGWAIKDHLAHLAAWDEVRAAEVERISAGFESAWRMSSEQDGVYNALAEDLRRGLSLAQARWEFETSRAKLLDAVATATPRGLDASLYGEAGLRSGHEAEHTAWVRKWRAEKGI